LKNEEEPQYSLGLIRHYDHGRCCLG
jgi:hypothetical protein